VNRAKLKKLNELETPLNLLEVPHENNLTRSDYPHVRASAFGWQYFCGLITREEFIYKTLNIKL